MCTLPTQMNRPLVLVVAVTVIEALAFGQSGPTVQWERALGGTEDERANAVVETTDGGYVFAGFATSQDGDVQGLNGGYDLWVVKLNTLGALQWQTTFGGSSMDYGADILAIDTGFVVVGGVWSNDSDVVSNHGSRDVAFVVLNDSGAIRRSACFGGTDLDGALSVCASASGGFFVVGTSKSNDGDVTGNHGNEDMWVLKISDSLTLDWQRSLGGTIADAASEVAVTADGGYIISGTTYSNDGDVNGGHGGADAWIIKLNALGEIEWQRVLGGQEDESFSSVLQTTDGGYIAAGSTESNDADVTGNHGESDVWVVKLDPSGELVWQRTFGGSDREHATAIRPAMSGGYIIGGNTRSNDGDVTQNPLAGVSAWLLNITDGGDLNWQRTVGGSANDQALDLLSAGNGDVVVVGGTNSQDGDVANNHGGEDAWVIKFNADVGMDRAGTNVFSVAPNPTDGRLLLSGLPPSSGARFELATMVGQTLLEQEMSASSAMIDLSGLSPGVYVVRLRSPLGQESRLVLLE